MHPGGELAHGHLDHAALGDQLEVAAVARSSAAWVPVQRCCVFDNRHGHEQNASRARQT